MTTKLQLYNAALRMCKERRLSSLTENREPRRLLDDVYADGGIDHCLEEGLWKFATRTVRLDYDADITPEFGFRRAFAQPDDYVDTVAVCSDEYFTQPLLQYANENGYWYAELDEIYVKYVSNHADYGYNLGIWPASFSQFVAAYFAYEIVDKLTGSSDTVVSVEKKLYRYRKDAKNNDAQRQPQKFPAPGAWASSRGNTLGRTRDRGNRNRLIG